MTTEIVPQGAFSGIDYQKSIFEILLSSEASVAFDKLGVTCRDDAKYWLPAKEVSSIERLPALVTPLPFTKKFVLGTCTLGNRTMLVIDPALLLGKGKTRQGRYCVCLKRTGLALLAEEVGSLANGQGAEEIGVEALLSHEEVASFVAQF